MQKILLIIKREFITRVRKKNFLLMSLIGPLMITGVITLMQGISTKEANQLRVIAVVDQSDLFRYHLPESKWIKFSYPQNENLEDLKNNFYQSDYYAILHIPVDIVRETTVILYSDRNPNPDIRMYIKSVVEKKLKDYKLLKNNISPDIIQSVNSGLVVRPVVFNKDGELKEVLLKKQLSIGMTGGMLMYFFIFLFGVQVMKGTFEEKNNRIVEIILSSVRPFQLMMGKIVGIGLTGILQIVLKMTFTILFLYLAKLMLFSDLALSAENQFMSSGFSDPPAQDSEVFFHLLEGINFTVIILSLIIYFICGYFLYASLFAAVGAAIDQDSDTQQFILPITLPLLFAVFIMIVTSVNPEHSLCKVFSIFPLTSPIVMMARIPSGVPISEILLSVFLLIVSFLGTTWLAGRIYKTGILMYGKKVRYRDLWRWVKVK